MKEIIMENGDLTFLTSSEIDGFVDKVVNSIQIFSVETFYNMNNGLNFEVIASNFTEYKLEHIRSKIMEWYKSELISLKYTSVKTIGKTVKATLQFEHKTLGNITSEVII